MDVHKGEGVKVSCGPIGTGEGLKTFVSCGNHKWMTPSAICQHMTHFDQLGHLYASHLLGYCYIVNTEVCVLALHSVPGQMQRKLCSHVIGIEPVLYHLI